MSIHQMCLKARHTRCNRCCVPPGKLCACGLAGVCATRMARASELVGAGDFASAIHDGLAEDASGIILDPEVTR